MGGPGSGNRSWRRTRRDLVQDAIALDAGALVRTRRMVLGKAGTGRWEVCTSTGNRRMTIHYDGDLRDLENATFCLRFYTSGIECSQHVRLTVTEQHLGGRRVWFLCPITGQRARILYLPFDQGQFASREAHGLSYRSQGESPLFRSITRAQNIRSRLGGDLSIHSPFPARPRGMHRRTYERLRVEGLKIETEALGALMARERALTAETLLASCWGSETHSAALEPAR